MTNDELLEAFSEHQKMRGFAVKTLYRRYTTITKFARGIAPTGLLEATEEDCLDFLVKYRSASTRHGYRSDLIVFYKWCIRRRLIVESPAADIESIKQPRHLPRPVAPGDLAAALATADGDVQLAMLLGALAGLRRSEIAAMHSDHIDLAAEHPILIVRDGKGGKDRVVPLHPELIARLRNVPTGWVFPAPGGGHMKPATVAAWIRAAFQRVDSTATTHQLRHYFGSQAAQAADGNILLVAQLMGHDKPETTMGYVAFRPSNGSDVVGMIASHVQADEMTKRRQARAGGE